MLTTLKNFYGWMVDSEYVAKNPTKTIDLLELESPETQDLSEAELVSIYQVAAESNYRERNTALVSILLHGLRAAEVSALNLEDYDGTRLHIRKAKSDSKGYVPLKERASKELDAYLEWRSQAWGRTSARESFIYVAIAPQFWQAPHLLGDSRCRRLGR